MSDQQQNAKLATDLGLVRASLPFSTLWKVNSVGRAAMQKEGFGRRLSGRGWAEANFYAG